MYQRIHSTERFARQSMNHAALVRTVREEVAAYVTAPKHVLTNDKTGESYSFTVRGEMVEVQMGRCPSRTMTKEAARAEYARLLKSNFKKW